MYNYDDIDSLHIELTSRCNCRCAQCARVADGKVLPHLPLTELPLEVVRKVSEEMGEQLRYVHVCGNYGDVVAYSDFHSIVDTFHSVGSRFLKVYSNGSAQKPDWWSELGRKLNGDRGQVVFSIDGLEDTNHLYRVGSNWDIIMRNVRSFIDAGGTAVWEFLPFEHNEHQVDDVIDLASDMGFAAIIIKRNPRFSPLNNGEHHTLRPSKLYVHQGIKRVEGLEPTLFPIRCKYKARRMIYIDFEGHLLPCCWHGNRYKANSTGKNEFQEIMERYGLDTFDVGKHGVREILSSHPWFVKDMEYTIKILSTCRKHCTMASKMSNKDNRDVYRFREFPDPEPWE